jgi:hypothetical protein
MCFFDEKENLLQTLGFCNSCIVNPLLQCISPTLDFHEGPVGTLPISNNINFRAVEIVNKAIEQKVIGIPTKSHGTSPDCHCCIPTTDSQQ